MLKTDFTYLKYVFFICFILAKLNGIYSFEAPLLDIENESIGYLGSIGERNVLVDLKPHLQIKNIDSINGICSYHVFKPTSEDFPFTIDIKDKTTGEAVIEVIKKDSETNTDLKHKYIFLDCNKRKEYDFLIQAHDCSTPSVASNKVPVKIEVIDHDDYLLKFEQDNYQKTLIESNDIYENFMSVRARDNDCSNDGYACSYKLLTQNLIPVEPLFPFKIDNTGFMSTLRSIKGGEQFDFVVRAFDCLNNQSFVDAQISISVHEPCVPQWKDYDNEIQSVGEKTNIFSNLKPAICNDQNTLYKQDTECNVDSVTAKLVLNLDSSIKNDCKKCDDISNEPNLKTAKITFFNGGSDKMSEDEDSLENDSNDNDDDEEKNDENKILPSSEINLKDPISYQTFSKTNVNPRKIDFDGSFGNDFVLSAWIRRPVSADKTLKEQVLCGTDSKSLNRHHFGLYFYRGNLKFLLRRESNEHKDSKQDSINQDSSNIDSNEAFYPSLWEWSLYEPILSDNRWHFYEIKFNYPNASLYIDGVQFVENNTNSDIIDAYELNDAEDTGPITTYIGACYHARTQTFTDNFEGDIGSVILTKNLENIKSDETKSKCNTACDEFIDASSIGTENFLHSIETSNLNELTIKASSLDQIGEFIKKINYINKESNPQMGSRTIKLSTSIHCQNNGKNIDLNEINVNIKIKNQKPAYKILLKGDKQLSVSKSDLENGFEPFKDILITKSLVDSDKESGENNLNDDNLISVQSNMLSKCQIKIIPDRNLMAPSLNNEKVMFLQNLLDEFSFKFEETLNTVLITGMQSIKNYENFIRHLTYVIININEIESDKLELIKNKKFLISCTDAVSKQDTNFITVQVNLLKNEPFVSKIESENIAGPIAHKQLQSFVVSENDDDILQKKSEFSPLSSKNTPSSPIIFVLLIMASCAIGFLLVFGAIKMYTSRVIGKRKPLPNEENPQMEWDDSGLNITENPLETLEMNKETGQVIVQNLEYEEDEYSSYDEDDEDEFNQDEQYSSEEEPGKIVERELEWDDTSLEIKLRDKQLQQNLSKSISNKSTKNFIDPNQFV